MIPAGMDPISVFGRQLDWMLHGVPAGMTDPGLAMATTAYGILYMIIILGTPAIAILLYMAWKEYKIWLNEIQARHEQTVDCVPEDR